MKNILFLAAILGMLVTFNCDLNAQSYDQRIQSSTDDATEDNGNMQLTDGKLVIQGSSTFRNGLRFTGITIPAGATINSAVIEFVADAGNSTATSTTIYGQDGTASPPTFSSSPKDITGRLLTSSTTASVTWTFGAWSEEGVYQSPDLSTIVQEIVDDQSGLSGGAIVFLFDGTTGDKREPVSYDGESDDAPRLIINWGSCSVSLTQSDESACFDNSTPTNASDDYFQITFNATTTGAGSQYEVVTGANADGTGGTVLNTGGTNFGSAVTIGTNSSPPFVANGSTTYDITVRVEGDETCHADYTTSAIPSCSLCTSSSGTYRDEFSSVSYNNSNGTQGWSATPWMEFNDGANGPNGNSSCFLTDYVIYVAQSGDCTYTYCPNGNNCLTFNTIGGGVGDYISRQINLANLNSATLTFDYNISFFAGDEVQLQVRTGGGSWNTLTTYNATGSGTANFSLNSYLAADTEIRFIETGAAGGYFAIDNFQIAYECCSASPAAGTVTLIKN